MQGSVEECEPGADGGRAYWVVEYRPDRLICVSALEEEDDFAFRQEDCHAVEGRLGRRRGGFSGEKLFGALASV
jgi:hypothetical protein